jgi:prefoldin subunit 5
METQEKPTITIDDKSYIIEDLSEAARYCIAQIQDLQQQVQGARARVDQLEMANRGFMDALKVEIDKVENPAPEGE